MASARTRVTSADGTEIAVFSSGNPAGPVLVAVHGYPDNHTVWEPLAAELGERYRVVTYDVRGAGASGKPAGRAAYRIERLTEDFAAVVDEVSPDAPVHLLAHDWGSIQSWGPVTDPRFADRIASFTSISGPDLHYVGAWLRDRAHPMASLRQVLHSWYIVMFQIPWLPERVVRLGNVDAGIARAELRAGGGSQLRNPVARGEADKVNGIQLYRANMLRILARPRPVPTSVPVQVLAPTHDPFASVALVTQSPVPYVDDLTVQQVDGSHWIVSEQPEVVAALVDTFATAHAAGDTSDARSTTRRR